MRRIEFSEFLFSASAALVYHLGNLVGAWHVYLEDHLIAMRDSLGNRGDTLQRDKHYHDEEPGQGIVSTMNSALECTVRYLISCYRS